MKVHAILTTAHLLWLIAMVIAFAQTVYSQESGTDDIPPSITTQPTDVTARVRIPVTLNCEATGVPDPAYFWKKDGVLIDVDNNTRITLDGGNLVIDPPASADNGQYQCFANNRLGTALSNKVNIILAVLGEFKDTQATSISKDVGQPLTLQCGSQFGPPAGEPLYLYWVEDTANKPTNIEYDARVNQDADGNLVFSNVVAGDQKSYVCTALNIVLGLSLRSPPVHLTVNDVQNPNPVEAALVVKPSPVITAIRTEELLLRCIAQGFPTPNITWKREDEQLLSGGRISIISSGQELTISDVEFGDAGTYSCEASNGHGSGDRAETRVTVDSAPYFAEKPSDETKGPGESVDIRCSASGVPSPTVSWLVNGVPWSEFQNNYDVGGRWTVTTGEDDVATISITDLVTTDSNVFQCLASNKYKEAMTSVVLNVVSIEAHLTEIQPQSRQLMVLESSSATFSCAYMGIPAPTLTWQAKGSTLVAGDKYTMDEATGTLVINDIVEDDTGEYTCIVANSFDGEDYSQDATIQLNVLGNTRIDIPPEDQTVREGQSATFQCEIWYDHELPETPTIYWKKGSERLDAADDGSLSLTNCQIDDSGPYTCVVETLVDQAAGTTKMINSTATLTVKGRPLPPFDVRARNTEIELNWQLRWEEGNDNNAPIEYFTLQYDTIWDDMQWLDLRNVTRNGGSGSFIENLQLLPGVEYRFRVIAVNEVGKSDPSPSSDAIMTTVQRPTRNPENVQGSSTNPHTMIVSWDALHPIYYGGENFTYVVSYKKQGAAGDPTEALKKPGESSPTFIVDASKPYEAFEISVRSWNNNGYGPGAATVIGRSGEAPPTVAPGNVQVESISPQQLRVTWDPIPEEDVNGELQGYNVYYTQQIQSGGERQKCTDGQNCVIQGLQAFSTYEIKVRAYTGAGEGPPSPTIRITTMEDKPGPVELDVTAYSERLVLNWQKPIHPNGIIRGYLITVAPFTSDTEVGQNTTYNITDSAQTSKRLQEGIKPETRYRIQIAAYNKMGLGDPSQEGTEEPMTLLAGKPAKPPVPKTSGTGTTHINVTWNLADVDPTPNTVLVEYRVKSDSGSYKQTKSVDILDANEIMVSNLSESTTYQMRLRVTNAEGSTESDVTEEKTTGRDAVTNPGFAIQSWLIVLICVIILLILILLIICIIKSQKGGKYNVSDKEKQLKNDIESTPLKDDGGFEEYKAPTDADGEPLRGSQGSLNDSEPGSSESDSLKEYADGETGKFDEEGSFIGQYGDNKKARPAEDGDQGGAAYSTFV